MKLRPILGAVLLLGFLGGCTRRSQDDPNLQILHWAQREDIKTLDPANAYDVLSAEVMNSVYETLYEYRYFSQTYELAPLLAAEKPIYSKDHLTLTIPIKKGIYFQDDPCFEGGKGRELTAEDVVYGMKRLAYPPLASRGAWIFEGKVRGFSEFEERMKPLKGEALTQEFERGFEGIRALDSHRLQIQLLKPYPQLIYLMAMTFTAPVPREAVKKYGDEQGNLTERMVGTGPFKLKSWQRGARLVLERNPKFRKELYPAAADPEFKRLGVLADAGKPIPFLDRIEVEVMKEAQPRWLTFISGNVDAVEVPKDNFSSAVINRSTLAPELTAKGIRLQVAVGGSFWWVGFNMKDELFQGQRGRLLRQALSAALDRDAWIQTFNNGAGVKMTTLLPPGLGDRPKVDRFKFDHDVKKAQDLLTKAGYPGGQGLPVLHFDLRGMSSTNRQLGEFMTQQWARLGLKIEVIPNTFPAFLEKAKQGRLQIYYGGWSLDYPDAENVYQLLYGKNGSPGPNDSQFDHPEFNRLYEQMAVLEPGPKRAVLVRRMDEIAQEESPWAWGYFESVYSVSHPWLLNYRADDMIYTKFKYVRIDPELKKRYKR